MKTHSSSREAIRRLRPDSTCSMRPLGRRASESVCSLSRTTKAREFGSFIDRDSTARDAAGSWSFYGIFMEMGPHRSLGQAGLREFPASPLQ